MEEIFVLEKMDGELKLNLEKEVTETEKLLIVKSLDTLVMLLDKNKRYGNSSLEPVGVFGSVKRESKIEARMEDKLARIRNITRAIPELEKECKEDMITHYKESLLDAVRDLRGYLVLYEIALEGE